MTIKYEYFKIIFKIKNNYNIKKGKGEDKLLILIFLIMCLFFAFGVFKSLHQINDIIINSKIAISTHELKRIENEKNKEYFMDYNSIYDMDDSAKYYFCKYVLNDMYINNCIINDFLRLNNIESISDFNLEYIPITTDSILNLINSSFINSEYKEKTIMNDTYIIACSDREHDGIEGSYIKTEYYKITLLKEKDLDLILKSIKETGGYSLNLFIENISKSQYYKYLS